MKSVYTFLFGLVVVLSLPAARGETAPLPSLDMVIQRVMQTSATENADYHTFNQHYFYTRDKATKFFDSSGAIKQSEESVSTNNPIPSPKAFKPHPPTPHAVYSRQTATTQPANIHGVELGKKEDLINPDLVKRFKLTMVDREMINGRPTLVIDFKPVSNDLPVFNIKDRVINSIAGRAWVDEQDYQLEKAELHLTQKLTVLGGIVGSVSKFTFSFERDRTPDGYWYTRSLKWHLEAHEATIPRIVDHSEEVSNLQKMR
jgi:hypothetical protein